MEQGRPLDLKEFYRKFLVSDDEKLIERMASHSRIIKKEKGDFIFRPEMDGPSTTFLLSGVAKTFILSPDGTENSFALYFQPGTAVCMTKDMINIPGIYYKALTPVTLIELVGPGPYELAEEYPDCYRELTRGWMPFYYGMMDKLRANTTLTAKDRYLWFLNKYAPIVDQISQVEIAAFLGIKPQSLSRIRNELASESEVTPRKILRKILGKYRDLCVKQRSFSTFFLPHFCVISVSAQETFP